MTALIFECGAVWDGAAPKDERHIVGNGTLTLGNGQAVSGCWGTDGLSGPGTRTWPSNGCRYTGELVDGHLHGRGELTWPAAAPGATRSYVGQFRASRYHGRGTLVWRSTACGGGTCTYRGGFDGGRLHGNGALDLPDGSRYEGEFMRGLVSGRGALRRGGAVSEGTWRNGRLHGPACAVRWKLEAARSDDEVSFVGAVACGVPTRGRVRGAGGGFSALYDGEVDAQLRPHGAGCCEWVRSFSTREQAEAWQDDATAAPPRSVAATRNPDNDNATEARTRYVGEWGNGEVEGHGAVQLLRRSLGNCVLVDHGTGTGTGNDDVAEYVGAWARGGRAADVMRVPTADDLRGEADDHDGGGVGSAADDSAPQSLPPPPRLPTATIGRLRALSLFSIIFDFDDEADATNHSGEEEVEDAIGDGGSGGTSIIPVSIAIAAPLFRSGRIHDVWVGGVDERGERHGRGVYYAYHRCHTAVKKTDDATSSTTEMEMSTEMSTAAEGQLVFGEWRHGELESVEAALRVNDL